MSALAFDGVALQYGTQTALSLASLTIERGERVALLGSSGAGKTSLLRLAAGLITTSHGTVTTLGSNLATVDARRGREVRRRVGMISQGVDLIDPLTVAHNVSAGRIGERSLFSQLRDLVHPSDTGRLGEVLATVGLEHKMGERVLNLSGGERQRVAIARLRYQAPDLVLADEPVASLDPARGREVMALLVDLHSNQTLVVSLHNPELAVEHCQRVIGLRDGVQVFDRPATEVDEDELRGLYSLSSESLPGTE